MADHIKQQYVHTEMLVRLDEQTVQTDIIIDKLDDVGYLNPDDIGLTNEEFETLKTDILDFNKLLTERVTSSNKPPSVFDEDMQPYTGNPSVYDRLADIIDYEPLKAYIDSSSDLMYKSTLGPIRIPLKEEVADEDLSWEADGRLDFEMDDIDKQFKDLDDEYNKYQNEINQEDTIKSSIAAIDAQSIVKPNWTTSVDSPTYHITLYLVNTEVYHDPERHLKNDSALNASATRTLTDADKVFNSMDKFNDDTDDLIFGLEKPPPRAIIVAESGVTSSFVIDNLSYTAMLTTPEHLGGATIQESGSFEIVEIGGFEFMYKISAIAATMGFTNFNDAKFILRVGFQGRDPETGKTIYYPNMPGRHTPHRKPVDFYYPLMISSITSDTGPSGTTYNCTAAYTTIQASYRNVKSAITLTNVTTVKSFLEKLQTGLNKYEDGNGAGHYWAIRYDINPVDTSNLHTTLQGINNSLDFPNQPFGRYQKDATQGTKASASGVQTKTTSNASKSTKKEDAVTTQIREVSDSCTPIPDPFTDQISPNKTIDTTATAQPTKIDLNKIARKPDIFDEMDGGGMDVVVGKYGTNEDIPRFIRKKLSDEVPGFIAMTAKIKKEIKAAKDSDDPVPAWHPYIDIDTAVLYSDEINDITNEPNKVTIINVRVGWRALNIDDLFGEHHKMSEKAQIANYKAKNIIKRYDYMFSGANTEILNFRINHNALYKNIQYIDDIDFDPQKNTDSQNKIATKSPPATANIPMYLSEIHSNDAIFNASNLMKNLDSSIKDRTFQVSQRLLSDKSEVDTLTTDNAYDDKSKVNVGFTKIIRQADTRMQDSLNLDMTVVGDPDWLMSSAIIVTGRKHPIISKYIELEGLVTDNIKFNKPLLENVVPDITSTVSDLNIDLSTSMDVKHMTFSNFIPDTSSIAPYTGDNSNHRFDSIVSGVYKVNIVSSKLSSGRFTQDLAGYRDTSVSSIIVRQLIVNNPKNK